MTSTEVLRGLFVATLFSLCHTQTMDDAARLYDHVMTGYRKTIRAATDQSLPTSVQFEFDLLSIREVDEIIGKLSIIGILYLQWIDPRMTWNPYSFNTTFMLNIPQKEVWKPDLIVGYAVDNVKAVGYDHHWINVRYFFNGTAKYAPGDVLNAACAMDVAYYPFDIQECQIYFLPWGLLANEIAFRTPRDEVYMRYFTKHGEWALEEATTKVTMLYDLYPSVILNIRMRRRPTFVIVNVILPILFMCTLNILVFALPARSGERVSYAITVLLAIAVFLTLVVENLPKTSEPMSTLCYFLLTNLVLSSLIMFCTIYNLSIYNRSEDKPKPQSLLWIATLMGKRRAPDANVPVQSKGCIGRDKTDVHVIELQQDTPKMVRSKPATNQPPSVAITKEAATLGITKEGSSQDDDTISQYSHVDPVWTLQPDVHHHSNQVTWPDVSYAIDKLAILVCSIWMLGSAITFFIMVVTQKVPGA